MLLIFAAVALFGHLYEAASRCKITVVDGRGFNAGDFTRLYEGKKPVILQHLTEQWHAYATWSKDNFSRIYGDLQVSLEVQVSDGSGKSTRSSYTKMTMGEYIDTESRTDIALSFDSYTIRQAIQHDVSPTPSALLHLMAEPVFTLGRAGTGADFHQHDENWIAQVSGRKVWFTAPPTTKGFEKLRGSQPCTFRKMQKPPYSSCTALPGDVLYLPTAWYHATCNLDDFTVGVGGRGQTTSLHEACGRCSLADIASAARDTRVSSLDMFGRPAVYICVSAGCSQGADYLLSKSAKELSVDVDYLDGGQAIHAAATNGHATIVELITSRRANLNAQDSKGEHALHVASMKGHSAAVDILLAAGANVSAINHKGQQPMHSAAMGGHSSVAKLLTASRADVSAASEVNTQPMHFAAYGGHDAVAEVLTFHRAALDVTDQLGLTPLKYAAAGSQDSMLKLLMKMGAGKAAYLREL